MNKYLSVLVFISAFLVSNAQQDYQITHYMFDNISFNPGYAGMNNNICGTILGRQQWAGFEGSPTTGILNDPVIRLIECKSELLKSGLLGSSQ